MAQQKPIFEPVCQVRGKSLVLFDRLANSSDFATPDTKFQSGRSRQVYIGQVTPGAKKRIKKAIQTLLLISPTQEVIHPAIPYPVKFRLSFITLTLPSEQKEVDDKTIINKALQPFLRECSRKDKLKHYIWKAERQKNGNIHFHITTNVFIYYQTVQDRWNNYMRSTGLMNEFEKKFGHSNPHSTEIRAVRKMGEIERYMQKYFCKTNQYDEIVNGKIWDCSLSLKAIKWPDISITSEVFQHLNKTAQEFNDQIIEMDKCTVLWFKEWQRKAILNSRMSQALQEFIDSVKSFQRSPVSKKISSPLV